MQKSLLKILKHTLFASVIWMLAIPVWGQLNTFVTSVEQPPKVLIQGGSTLHDWSVDAPDISGFPETLEFVLVDGGSVAEFSFRVAVETMEGGRGSTMNKKIFNALKASDHPYISYTQTGPASISSIQEDGSFNLLSTGNLTIAGVQKEVEIEVKGRYHEDRLTFEVTHPLKMTDYDIDPPSAMFGQIQTKDDINIVIDFTYEKS